VQQATKFELHLNLKTAGSSLQDLQLPAASLHESVRFTLFASSTTDRQPPSVGNLWAAAASDIEGPTDLDRVGLCFETEISRGALDSCMAQERSNGLQIASSFQNVESLCPS
jgi:hypothetical protein